MTFLGPNDPPPHWVFDLDWKRATEVRPYEHSDPGAMRLAATFDISYGRLELDVEAQAESGQFATFTVPLIEVMMASIDADKMRINKHHRECLAKQLEAFAALIRASQPQEQPHE